MDRLNALAERRPWLARALAVQKRVGEVSGGSVASSVTLTVFVSLFPLMLAGIAILGFLAAGNADVPNRVINSLSLSGTAADTVRNVIATAEQSRRTASIVGVAGLLWSGLGVTNAITMAVRVPWQQKPEGLKGRLSGLLWLFGAVLLAASAGGLGAVMRLLPGSATKVLISLLLVGVGLAVETGLFVWTFWVLGDRRVGWRALLPGSIMGAIGLEALKLGATLYLPRLVQNSSALYGPLGVVFAILAWLALFARLLVYSSALNAVTYEADVGTVTLEIKAPRFDDTVALEADRGGAVVTSEEH